MDENSCFASTMSYSGILFYTVGNVVYRLDFKQSGGKATPVYTHAGGKATMMKFAKKAKINTNYLDFTNYEFDPNRSLGIVFDMGNGKCDFVVLNLSVQKENSMPAPPKRISRHIVISKTCSLFYKNKISFNCF